VNLSCFCNISYLNSIYGATFPVMSCAFVTEMKKFGLHISELYPINTFSGVARCVLAGFLFIPTFGLRGTNSVAVVLNSSAAFLHISSTKKFHELKSQIRKLKREKLNLKKLLTKK
jgi:hypothetical protein